MKQGCLIFAHNGFLDYGSQAVLAARLAQKHLKVPVSLVTDKETLDHTLSKFSDLPFDQTIVIDAPVSDNKRYLQRELISFKNDSRVHAYDLTPYDQTLMIDSDFLIFSNTLNKYWNLDYDLLITPGMLELQEHSVAPTEYKISSYSIDMLWATNVMFNKTPEVKIFFDLLKYIQQEYEYFSYLYEFDHRQYRNDYAFSIACHIMSGYSRFNWHGFLPVPLLFRDTDTIVDIKDNGQITFLLKDIAKEDDYLLARSADQDLHIMNKKDLLANLDRLMELSYD